MCAVLCVQCVVLCVQFEVLCVQCAVFWVQCAVLCVQCAVCSVPPQVLAALYSSEGSVMERHHFAQSMCILNTGALHYVAVCYSVLQF